MEEFPETVAEALASLKTAMDEFWTTLEADGQLDDDEKADITQLLEGAGDNIDEARKIVHANADRD